MLIGTYQVYLNLLVREPLLSTRGWLIFQTNERAAAVLAPTKSESPMSTQVTRLQANLTENTANSSGNAVPQLPNPTTSQP